MSLNRWENTRLREQTNRQLSSGIEHLTVNFPTLIESAIALYLIRQPASRTYDTYKSMDVEPETEREMKVLKELCHGSM